MLNIAYAMSAPPQAAGQASAGLGGLIPIILIFAIFYFLLIRPQQKMQKKKEQEHRDMLENLKKNDEIVTTGGIHGTVVNIKDKTIVLRLDDNCRVEFQKSSISFLKK